MITLEVRFPRVWQAFLFGFIAVGYLCTEIILRCKLSLFRSFRTCVFPWACTVTTYIPLLYVVASLCYLIFYLFIWPYQVLVVACGIYFPWPEIKPRPLQWRNTVSKPLEKSGTVFDCLSPWCQGCKMVQCCGKCYCGSSKINYRINYHLTNPSSLNPPHHPATTSLFSISESVSVS